MTPPTRHAPRRRHALIAAVALLVTLTACEGNQPVSTMSRAEAERRVETYIHDAAALLTPPPQLKVDSKNEIPCTEPGSANDGDSYAVEHTYLLQGYPKDNNTKALDTVRTYWSANGYAISKEERDTAGTITGVSAKHTVDKFFVRLWHNAAGDLFLVASSTCVTDDPS